MLEGKWKVPYLALSALASLSLVIAACGDDDDDDNGDDGGNGGGELVAADVDCSALDVEAPARIGDAGTLTVASDLSYAPMEFVREGTNDPIGVDVDIANCIAEAWGVEANVQNTPFDAIIPALTSGQADIIMSSLSVTPERAEQVDFVEYMVAGSGILVEEGNPEGIESLEDLCGLNVAIQLGTVQIDEADEQNASCDEEISIQTFEQNTDTIAAVGSGRAAAALMDYPVAAYGASQVDGTEVVGAQYNTGPYGIAVRKDDTEVRDAIQATIDAMRDGGQYDDILAYWGVEAGALD